LGLTHPQSPNVPTPGSENPPPNPQKSLLDLLRNSGSPASPVAANELPAPTNVAPAAHVNPSYQASDLVASFAPKPPSQIPTHSSTPSGSGPEVSHPQDFLLKLLNNPKPAQHDSPSSQSPLPPTDSRASPLEPARGINQGQFTSRNPFDQLAASSPRNRTPQPGHPTSGAAPKMEILKHGGQKSKLSSEPSPRTTTDQDGYKPPTPRHGESVAEAVSEMGSQVEKQVEQALGFGDNPLPRDEVKDVAKETAHLAGEIKAELADGPTRQMIEDQTSKAVVETLEKVADDVENADIADSWEDTSDKDGLREYKVPLKPFVAIELTGKDAPGPFHPNMTSHIAKLKKDFDQIDRTLATATNNYIIYGGSKHGGFRLICQKSGANKQLFQSANERIFNVSLCRVSPLRQIPEIAESAIATGINGSVYWVELPKSDKGGEAIEGQNLESQGFIFPPEPAHDDNTSGSQLRTRAKKSNRHPEYFAIGRGRSIHLIFPAIARHSSYTNQSTRVCNSAKYLKERCLKIDTGKAGKDFAFSEDDTVIVSLDKAGRMRFWDIRSLTDTDWEPGEMVESISRVPALTFYTTSPTDKSWPTSVLFIDKDRPTLKGLALRYLVVGMKQNHTLQLWDLGLEKPVQEISFPHENESDGICSVAYHAKTGYLIVGHPTRNSIYLIAVSAPKYNLPSMSQAQFLDRLVGNGDPLPKPDSTAIMGSVREFSFKGEGQLRSVDLLNDLSPPEHYEEGEAPLFELYVMHSKGVTCFGLKKEDIVVDKANVISAKDSEQDGHILVKEIKVVNQAEHQPSEPSTNGDQVERPPPPASKASARETRKDTGSVRTTQSQLAQSTLARVENQQDQARAAILNGSTEKPEKEKKKKKKGAAAAAAAAAAAPDASTTPSQIATPQPPVQQSASPTPAGKEMATSSANTGSFNMAGLATEVERLFKDGLSDLRMTINDDRRTQDAESHGRQEALLRVVSRTLTENVEASLKHIVAEQIQRTMMPRIDQAVDQALASSLKSVLPKAVNEAMQEPDIVRNVSELVVQKVSMQLNNSNHSVLQQVLETERRLNAQLQVAEAKRQADAEKIEELTNMVSTLTQTVQTMAVSQENLQRLLVKQREPSPRRPSPPAAAPAPRQPQHDPSQSQNDPMMNIVDKIRTGNFEEGAVLVCLHQR
jgi:WD40 repeat protein